MLVLGRHPDEDDQRVLIHSKSNYGREAPGLLIGIEPILLPAGAGVPEIETSRIVELGETHLGADTVLGPSLRDEDRDTLGEAKDFLDNVLGEGPLDALKVKEEAKAAGVSETTLNRAKKAKGVVSKRVGGPGSAGHWTWELPSSGPLRLPTPIHPDDHPRANPHENTTSAAPEPLRGPSASNGALSAEERATAKRLINEAKRAELERQDAEEREHHATLFADDPGFIGTATYRELEERFGE